MLSEFIAMTIKSEDRESHNLSSYHEDNKARICTKSVQESKAIKSEVKRVMVVEKDVEELCLCSAQATQHHHCREGVRTGLTYRDLCTLFIQRLTLDTNWSNITGILWEIQLVFCFPPKFWPRWTIPFRLYYFTFLSVQHRRMIGVRGGAMLVSRYIKWVAWGWSE